MRVDVDSGEHAIRERVKRDECQIDFVDVGHTRGEAWADVQECDPLSSVQNTHHAQGDQQSTLAEP